MARSRFSFLQETVMVNPTVQWVCEFFFTHVWHFVALLLLTAAASLAFQSHR